MARWLSLVLLSLLVLSAVGCRKAVESTVDRNKPPTTWLTGAPPDSSEGPYKFHIYWGGTDPDGVVAGYLVAITDSVNVPETYHIAPDPKDQLDTLRADPRFTTRTDSLFTFTANDPLVLAHRIYVAAIDNEGKIDQQALLTGHFLYFLARNRFAPQVFIDREVMRYRNEDHSSDAPALGNGHLTPVVGYQDTMPNNSDIRLRWHGTDRDPGGRVVSFSYHLDRPMFSLPDRGSHEAKFPDTSVSPESCALCQSFLPDGLYTLSVEAVDEAGATSDLSAAGGEQFVVGFDPVTFLTGAKEVSAAGTRTLNIGGQYTYTPPTATPGITLPGRDVQSPIPVRVPYIVTGAGKPDTLSDYSTLVLSFTSADSAGGDRGLVKEWQPAIGPQTIFESYKITPSFGDAWAIAKGLSLGFNSSSSVALATPAEFAAFTDTLKLVGTDYSGTNQMRVRARDLNNRWDGFHTYYPNVVFEVNHAPRYSVPGTYLQAGDATGPNPSKPQYFGANADGSGVFTSAGSTVIALTPDAPVLWVVFGPDGDADAPSPMPNNWIARRAVVQETNDGGFHGVGDVITSQWNTTTNSGGTVVGTSFATLNDNTTYRLDIALRDHANNEAEFGRNWSAWQAYRRGELAAPMTFTVSVTR